MTKMTKTLLVLAIAGIVSGMAFVTGAINASSLVALYTALPAGAIFFGLFLLSKILEKETALYDNEQRLAIATADGVRDKVDPRKPCCGAPTAALPQRG
jgi:hypothetical protein